jgi:hypothetical protein
MSEYQYYEFQAIDRPLTEKEMGELRSYSTRARITSTSFINDYSWGNFKGNENAWMEKYFDAFLYLANWGTHILKLRLPSRLLNIKTARSYCSDAGETMYVSEKNGKVILTFVSDDETGGEWVEGEGCLSSINSVRAEMARGDMRALYLGWLLCLQGGELDDEDEEPPVPPGLGQLSASLESLVDFLRIDSDLLYVAAQASRRLEQTSPKIGEIRKWVGLLPAREKDDLIARFITGEEPALAAVLMRRFIEENDKRSRGDAEEVKRRTVGDLLQAAEERTKKRRELATRKAAEEKARRAREAEIAREKHLDRIAEKEPELWTQMENLIATKLPKSYDRAVELLVDLRDLAVRRGEKEDFGSRLDALRASHLRKPSFIARVQKAGL